MLSWNDNRRCVTFGCLLLFFSVIFHVSKSEKYKVFWNVPTYMCHKYNISFDEILQIFDLIQCSYHNSNDKSIEFFSNSVEPLSNEVPEKVIIGDYLNSLTNELRWRINKEFSGLGILNYTVWQPFFRQNRGPLEYYYNRSIEIERELYPLFDKNQTLELASMRYEFASKNILIAIVNRVQKYWPQATWGFSDYPKCNYLPIHKLPIKCDSDIVKDNDRLDWLWNLNITLHPSLDLPMYGNSEKKYNLVRARLLEARRIANQHNLKVYPHTTFRYTNLNNAFIRTADLVSTLRPLLDIKTDGLIIRGSEYGTDSAEKCSDLNNYLNKFLGPLIKDLIKYNTKYS